MNWINYKELPADSGSFSSLFVDYINSYDKVEEYYNGDVRNRQSWISILEKQSSQPRDRSTLVQILTTQNRNFHCGVQTLSNIDNLLNENTFAVVTGQQVGIFTGPLYTIYKTLTVLKLTEQLSAQYPEYNFVPVFWLEGEDHDFEEVSSLTLIDKNNDLMNVSYQPTRIRDDSNYGAVGRIEFDESINELFAHIEPALVDTEFKDKMLDLLRTAYQRGMSFNKAFVHLMNDLLEDSGMIFLDPNDPAIKRLLQPLFARELDTSPKTCKLVISKSADLEKRYVAQIKPKPINLFFFYKNGRYLLEPHDEGYRLKGARLKLTRDEVIHNLEAKPEMFSPNVVLRPICQDSLLPTVCYVAGPSEVAYFAQLKPIYNEFGLTMPLIYPRASVTIIEDKVGKVFDRYNVGIEDFFRDIELLKQKVVDQSSDVKIEELFGGTSVSFEETFDSLERGLSRIDKTLAGSLSTARNKIQYHLEGLKKKAFEAQKRNHEVAMRQIDKAYLHLFPSSKLQERNLNIIHFFNKYGLEFLRWLRTELIIDKFKHQVIRM